jgi:hypothetical protein
MSAYTDAIDVGAEDSKKSDTKIGPSPAVVIYGPQPESGFWKTVRWLGALLTLVVGYREAKRLYEEHWGDGKESED